MIVHQVEQRSDAWAKLRAGKLTGSGAKAILAVRQKGSGELAIRANLRQRLIVERLTGLASDDLPYLPKDMRHGVEMEPDAFAAYEAAHGELVTRVGFVEHDELQTGCSPDGCVGDWEGIIELKCPSSAVHLEYVQGGVIPEDYYGQLLHALWITGAQWADFCSYDPRFLNPSKRLFTKRLKRNAALLEAYELTARLFLSEVDRECERLAGAVA